MADCYYHGQSSPGPCAQCQANRVAGLGDDGNALNKTPSPTPGHPATMSTDKDHQITTSTSSAEEPIASVWLSSHPRFGRIAEFGNINMELLEQVCKDGSVQVFLRIPAPSHEETEKLTEALERTRQS